ncbi:uncharacterized protein LOC143227287 [Tachypleus tridentatus]|uniref:uncharacterized protein LOC143227287 n=1 Tax=Tachypleus tridentatus TaxID=6853 RepID=UPI003FD1F44F
MKCLILIGCLFLMAVVALPRTKRAAYELPAGAEFIVGQIKTTFSCAGLHSGYYADVDNYCQIFHICHPQTLADGTLEVGHWSFFCGNQTIFNQMSFTCAFPEEAVPCRRAPDFYYLNNNIGVENAPFLTDDDVARAYEAIRSQ